MKNKLLYGLQIFLMLIILASIFVGLLVLSSLIPSHLLKNNMIDSLHVLKQEGYFPEIKNNFLLDNYTDALMLNTAYSVNYKEPLKSVMLNRRNYVADRNDIELKDLGNESENTIQNLEDTLNEVNTEYYEYSRYWHGYLVYLRPLLLLGDYSIIRFVLSLSILILSLNSIYLICKRIDLKNALIFVITLLSVSIYFMGLSMQYSSIFIITLISSIYILIKNGNVKDANKLFCIIGATTCFIDLLTSPMITYCIPLIIYLLLNNKNHDNNIKQNIITIFKLACFWVVGYGGIWLSKWLISDMLYNTGTITFALKKVLLQSGSNETINVTVFNTIARNIQYISWYLGASFLLALISSTAIVQPNKLFNKNVIKKNAPYLLIGIMPVIWYVIVKNHSYIHARFTYKNLCITVFCLLIIFINNISLYKSINSKGVINENKRN